MPHSNPDAQPIEIFEPLCAVFRRKLKAEGAKYTPERAQILNAIIEQESIFDADALMDQLKAEGRNVSKATIYRTLKLLADAGIIQAVLFDREQSHYQLVYGREPRTIIVNVDTGAIDAIDVPELIELRNRICEQHGLIPEGHRLQIFGRSAADQD